MKDPSKEIKRVTEMIDELEKWHAQLALHTENDPQDPGYCDYAFAQFYGEEFPAELALCSQGYLFRIYPFLDLPKLTK